MAWAEDGTVEAVESRAARGSWPCSGIPRWRRARMPCSTSSSPWRVAGPAARRGEGEKQASSAAFGRPIPTRSEGPGRMVRDTDPRSFAPRSWLSIAFTDAAAFQREFPERSLEGWPVRPDPEPYEPPRLWSTSRSPSRSVGRRSCCRARSWPCGRATPGAASRRAWRCRSSSRPGSCASASAASCRRRRRPALASAASRRSTPREPAGGRPALRRGGARPGARARPLGHRRAARRPGPAAPGRRDGRRGLRAPHPGRGAPRLVGTVVRHDGVSDEGAVVAVRFDALPGQATHVRRFVEDVQAADHARRLGTIAGPIAELGVASLLQMFALSSPAGTRCCCRARASGARSASRVACCARPARAERRASRRSGACSRGATAASSSASASTPRTARRRRSRSTRRCSKRCGRATVLARCVSATLAARDAPPARARAPRRSCVVPGEDGAGGGRSSPAPAFRWAGSST
ncbi:MAG: hypothetical protein MZV70_45540 [Desulfobacterales bacterium]|nr:hypothetical protein [Desulfobacterales bacterium]